MSYLAAPKPFSRTFKHVNLGQLQDHLLDIGKPRGKIWDRSASFSLMIAKSAWLFQNPGVFLASVSVAKSTIARSHDLAPVNVGIYGIAS
jgi:hypothetical protein